MNVRREAWRAWQRVALLIMVLALAHPSSLASAYEENPEQDVSVEAIPTVDPAVSGPSRVHVRFHCPAARERH